MSFQQFRSISGCFFRVMWRFIAVYNDEYALGMQIQFGTFVVAGRCAYAAFFIFVDREA